METGRQTEKKRRLHRVRSMKNMIMMEIIGYVELDRGPCGRQEVRRREETLEKGLGRPEKGKWFMRLLIPI